MEAVGRRKERRKAEGGGPMGPQRPISPAADIHASMRVPAQQLSIRPIATVPPVALYSARP